MTDGPPENSEQAFEERVLRRIPLEILLISLLIAVITLPIFSLTSSLFILVGGGFSAVSFVWLKQALGRFLNRQKRQAVRSGIAFYLLRLALIIAVFSVIILLFPRMVLAFVAGFSSVIPAFLIEAVMAIAQMKKWKS
jgi:hypothetical protein